MAVSVVEFPAQITDGEADAATLIAPLTDTLTEAEAEQPFNEVVTE